MKLDRYKLFTVVCSFLLAAGLSQAQIQPDGGQTAEPLTPSEPQEKIVLTTGKFRPENTRLGRYPINFVRKLKNSKITLLEFGTASTYEVRPYSTIATTFTVAVDETGRIVGLQSEDNVPWFWENGDWKKSTKVGTSIWSTYNKSPSPGILWGTKNDGDELKLQSPLFSEFPASELRALYCSAKTREVVEAKSNEVKEERLKKRREIDEHNAAALSELGLRLQCPKVQALNGELSETREHLGETQKENETLEEQVQAQQQRIKQLETELDEAKKSKSKKLHNSPNN